MTPTINSIDDECVRSQSGKAGFSDFGDSCFEKTEYFVDGKPISLTNTNAVIRGEAVQISARNIGLFGDRSVDTQSLRSSSTQQYVAHDISDVLKVDTFSNGDVFADEIPSKTYPFRIGHRVRLKSNGDWNGVISRLSADGICIKFDYGSHPKKLLFRWISSANAPKEVTLDFSNTGDSTTTSLNNYYFTVTDGEKRPPKDLPSEQRHSFSNVKSILIPSQAAETSGVSTGVYVKPSSMS